jgi:small subunit ribosomal protein S20
LPNIKSAIKRVRVSEKKNLRNRIIKTGVKTAVKKYKVSLDQSAETAGAQLRITTSAIDKAAAKGIIHKNTANRKKARLAKMLAKASV